MNRAQRRAEAKRQRKIKKRANRAGWNGDRAALVEESRRIFRRVFASTKGGIVVVERGACFYHCACLIYAARERGLELRLQAGTAGWNRVPIGDMSQGDTHFVYEWEGIDSPNVRAALATGVTPELHVWCVDPHETAIVDTTTPHLPEQCRETAGMDWLAPEPPDYLWATADEIPGWWIYRAAPDAMEFVEGEIADAIKRIEIVLGGPHA